VASIAYEGRLSAAAVEATSEGRCVLGVTTFDVQATDCTESGTTIAVHAAGKSTLLQAIDGGASTYSGTATHPFDAAILISVNLDAAAAAMSF